MLQRLRGSGGFFHQGSVLLGGLVHQRHGAAHLGNACALLLAGQADVGHDGGDLAHAFHHLVHGGASLLHQLAACLHLRGRFADQLLDLLGGCGAALGQRAHLRRHHGEAATLLTRAGSFHGRVQGEDVGLESNAVNDANDVHDLAGRCIDAAHGLHHLAHHRAGVRSHLRSAGGQLVGLTGIGGVLLHRSRQLFHGGGGFFQRACLLFSACRQILVAAGNLGRGKAHRLRRFADADQHLGDLVHELVERRGNGGQLVLALGFQTACEIALTRCDVTQRIADQAQTTQLAAHGHCQQCHSHQHAEHGDQASDLQHHGDGMGGFGAIDGNGQGPWSAFHLGCVEHLVCAVDQHIGTRAVRGQLREHASINAFGNF